MSALPPDQERTARARPDIKSGKPTFEWTTTRSEVTDTVRLIAGPFDALPVIFVPGIMGSNLKSKEGGAPVWRLDTTLGEPLTLAKNLAMKDAGERQRLLHPDRCEVDRDGAVPTKQAGSVSDPKLYRERGWGTVGQGSYHEFLLWLEEQLNPLQRNPAMCTDYSEASLSASTAPVARPKLIPGVRMGMKGQPFGAEKQPFASILADDLITRAKFMMPVYAEGYNWLGSNLLAAQLLQKRIGQIINEWNRGAFRCEQVILVTHSMGGLVARACAQLPGMTDKIAGVVHGVMPATGAAVAYRRCKVGMKDESVIAGMVIGSTGREVTAVFAQAPGALQLLPSHAYNAEWLRVIDAKGKAVHSLPKAVGGASDPYTSIYLQKDSWWGLINEAWLAPEGGSAIDWGVYKKSLKLAQTFHGDLVNSIEYTHTYESSHWELHCEMQDGIGDGTVPHSSGAAPLAQGGASVRQQFKLTGFDHEKSYKNATAQRTTLFAINKIAGTARRSA